MGGVLKPIEAGASNAELLLPLRGRSDERAGPTDPISLAEVRAGRADLLPQTE